MRRATSLLLVLLAVAWLVELRPLALGGPASYVRVSGTSMEPGLHTGDVVITRRRDTYRPGQTVAYRVPAGSPGAGHVVIHRIVGGDGRSGYRLRGDNREEEDLWRPRDGDVLGEQQVRLPALATAATAVLRPVGLGVLAAFAVFILVACPAAPPSGGGTPRRSRGARGSSDGSRAGTVRRPAPRPGR